MTKLLFIIIAPLILFLVVVGIVSANFTYRVDAGQVGLLIDYFHKDKNNQPVVTIIPQGSFIWYNSWNGQRVFEYPISLRTLAMVANPREGNEGDDSVTFPTAQGISLKIDVTTQWRVIHPEKLYFLMPGVPLDGEFNKDVSTKLVRQSVIHALTNNGGKYQWQEIAGHENELGIIMQKELVPLMSRYGIEIEQISLGQPHYNQQQQTAIDALTTAQQQALQAQFEKQKQQFLADAARIAAESQAAQIAIINKQLANSPDYLKYKEIDKWDGKLPSALATNGNTSTVLAPFGK